MTSHRSDGPRGRTSPPKAGKTAKTHKADKPDADAAVPHGAAPSIEDYLFDGSRALRLADIDPGAKPYSLGGKAQDKAAVEALAVELDALQNFFYADRRHKLLVVLQGVDTSGKDGTLRGVFGRMSPLGVRTVGWGVPSAEERRRDPLWRIHAQVPGTGEIVVFNRSHYEDYIVPTIDGALSPLQAEQRLRQINDFERMLSETGTVVCKFLLHISKAEQAERLQSRLDDPTKQWKLAASDFEMHARWDDYARVYQDAVAATATLHAPWMVVPADSKTHRNLMIATRLRSVIAALDLRYPPVDPALLKLRLP